MALSQTLLPRFREYCRRRRLIGARQKVIVAVSGGVDSVVLLDLLAKERTALGLDVIVAHFNHRLRGTESDGDEDFVAERARSYGLDFFVERANTAEVAKHAKIGIQEAARNLRYEFFDQLLISSGFDRVATGHNADDNTETILLNLFRGAGVQGLSGIPVYRQDRKIIRPLLFSLREEIESYAAEEHLQYRTDSSNEKDEYTRNFIRHRILPLIRAEVNPNIGQTLQRSADLFREMETYLAHHARQILDLVVTKTAGHTVLLSIPMLRSNPILLQQYVFMFVVEEFAGSRPDSEQIERITRLMESSTGSWVALSDGVTVFRDRDELVFRKGQPFPEFRIVIRQNHRYEFDAFQFSTETLDRVPDSLNGDAEYVDADKIRPADLVLRTWRDGDAFVPLGMTTKKKISDYFIDAKVPVYEKRSFPVLETGEGEIIWLCGQRIDDRFKVTQDTLRVLKLQFTRTAIRPNGEEH